MTSHPPARTASAHPLTNTARTQARPRLVVTAVAAGLILTTSLLPNHAGPAFAAEASRPIVVTAAAPGGASYVVQAGDTLGGIATKLGVSIDAQADWIAGVVAANGLQDANQIVVGQTLSLPPIPPASTSGQAVTKAAAGSPDGLTYTVKDGDTLLGIAIALGIPSGQRWDWTTTVQTMNNLSDSDFLKTGQVLAIPDPSTLPAPAASTSAPAPTKTPAPTVMPKLPATYKVQAGDENLYDLATRFGVPDSMQDAWVTKVVQLNHLDANGMYVGNVIKLPQ